jgi:mono/diheme cytochrome c family protein
LPDQVTDFTALYEINCAGCHGRDGRLGAARPLNDALYLAVVSKQTLRNVISNGRPRTAMPAFAQNAGGTLTDHQIVILADQIEARWSRPGLLSEVAAPPYDADPGDPKRGETVFEARCSSCHREGRMGGSVIDSAFLALVSDQSLRTSVIAGRTDRGMPDWRHHAPAMSPQEVSDVVAWLSAHRTLPVNLTKIGLNLP